MHARPRYQTLAPKSPLTYGFNVVVAICRSGDDEYFSEQQLVLCPLTVSPMPGCPRRVCGGEQREIQRKWVASSTRKRRVLSLWRVGEIVFRKHRPSLAKLEAVLSSLILSAWIASS